MQLPSSSMGDGKTHVRDYHLQSPQILAWLSGQLLFVVAFCPSPLAGPLDLGKATCAAFISCLAFQWGKALPEIPTASTCSKAVNGMRGRAINQSNQTSLPEASEEMQCKASCCAGLQSQSTLAPTPSSVQHEALAEFLQNCESRCEGDAAGHPCQATSYDWTYFTIPWGVFHVMVLPTCDVASDLLDDS